MIAKKNQRKRHRNSRLGCLNCKQRRIKCGEELESCYSCIEKGLVCSFLSLVGKEKAELQEKNEKLLQSVLQELSHVEPELSRLSDETHIFDVAKFEYKMTDSDIRKINKMNEVHFVRVLEVAKPAVAVGVSPSASLSSQSSQNTAMTTVASMPSSVVGTPSPLSCNTPTAAAATPPLPSAVAVNKKFSLVKITRKTSIKSALVTGPPVYTVSGEDDATFSAFRNAIFSWFQSLIAFGEKSIISFHHDISLMGSYLACQMAKTERRDKMMLLFTNVVRHRENSLRLAQRVVAFLHNPNPEMLVEYLQSAHEGIIFSFVNIGICFFSIKDEYEQLLAYINGYLSLTTMKDLISKFRQSFNRIKDSDHGAEMPYQLSILNQGFSVLHSHFLANQKTVYCPSIGLELMRELRDELQNFAEFAPEFKKRPDFIELNLLFDSLFSSELAQSFVESRVLPYSPHSVFRLMQKYFQNLPSVVVHFQHRIGQIPLQDIIFYMFWMCTGYGMDMVFPECYYSLMTKFTGPIKFFGITEMFLKELESSLRDEFGFDSKEYDFLYRKVVYLSRFSSYVCSRWSTYDRCLKVSNIYPENMDDFRLDSRKPEFIDETVVTSLKKGVINVNNYPRNKKNYAPTIPERHPRHPKNMRFVDDGFDINTHRDSAYDSVQQRLQDAGLSGDNFDLNKCPLELLKLSKFGLLWNIDFRPNLLNTKSNRVPLVPNFYSLHERELNEYIRDWRLVVYNC